VPLIATPAAPVASTRTLIQGLAGLLLGFWLWSWLLGLLLRLRVLSVPVLVAVALSSPVRAGVDIVGFPTGEQSGALLVSREVVFDDSEELVAVDTFPLFHQLVAELLDVSVRDQKEPFVDAIDEVSLACLLEVADD
jgi:hypothetical protein